MANNLITFRTIDNQIISVPRSVALLFRALPFDLEKSGHISPGGINDLPIQGRMIILKYAIQYASNHQNESELVADDNSPVIISQVDDAFLKTIADEHKYELLELANFLNCSGLIRVLARSIADSIKCLTIEQIQNKFHINPDLTPAELMKIDQENSFFDPDYYMS